MKYYILTDKQILKLLELQRTECAVVYISDLAKINTYNLIKNSQPPTLPAWQNLNGLVLEILEKNLKQLNNQMAALEESYHMAVGIRKSEIEEETGNLQCRIDSYEDVLCHMRTAEKVNDFFMDIKTICEDFKK